MAAFFLPIFGVLRQINFYKYLAAYAKSYVPEYCVLNRHVNCHSLSARHLFVVIVGQVCG